MNRGHYCTKIHKCYTDALRRIVHLGLFHCRQQRQPLTCSDILVGKRTNPTSKIICHGEEFMILDPSVQQNRLIHSVRYHNGFRQKASRQLHSLSYLDFEGPAFPASSAFFCFCCIISASLWETGKKREPFKLPKHPFNYRSSPSKTENHLSY